MLSPLSRHPVSNPTSQLRTNFGVFGIICEINDQQQVAWRKTLSVFDEQQQEYENLCLFPDDREIPANAVDTLQVKLSGLELRSPPMFGSCWLACELRRNVAVV